MASNLTECSWYLYQNDPKGKQVSFPHYEALI
jgi:hypothetical protein